MNGECDKCGEHCFGTAPVANSYWGYVDTDFNFNTLPQEHQDDLIRDFLESSISAGTQDSQLPIHKDPLK
jgi:hypothetical protein